jgi:hypothetical protein
MVICFKHTAIEDKRDFETVVCGHPGERKELYARTPKLEAHAKLVSVRPAVAKVDADNAQ